jgi:predicted unusual protein kinase regulating ubiquinone biosynthesis (AarF/ABC1/UbiB family)
MNGKPPTGKIGRALAGGRTAAKVGGQVLTYYAKRPFLSEVDRRLVKQQVTRQSAQTMFQGLSLLRGTALKMAQQLSLEMDLLPEAACRELAKAYHQVPPINRALARKVVQEALGKAPESAFHRFELDAFAAASLGQVHYAENNRKEPLAVKIQYPGIAKSIDSDVSLLRKILRPIVRSEHLAPSLDEIADRLREETDYILEARHLRYFSDHLDLPGVNLPKVLPHLSARTVLSTSLMPGKPLNVWLQDHPAQDCKDRVAQTLQDLVIKCIYDMNVIHADPNPGNFIIAKNGAIGLVDFGCVKRLHPEFINKYRMLALSAAHRRKAMHFEQIIAMGFISPDLAGPELTEIKRIFEEACHWFGRLFEHEYFDFGTHPNFMAEGKAVMRQYHCLRRHLRFDPEFIFLDRTRYGLLRLFEMMGARVRFHNAYEY